MEDFGCVWFYQESMDELRQKLQYATFELEALKMGAQEQAKKHQEELNQLLHLLSAAQKQRDEAREQVYRLIKMFMPLASCHSDTVMMAVKANSSVTESNSMSQSHNSSPVDSLLEAVSSPDLSNINANQPLVDEVDAFFESLTRGKALPQKGKFLQAVMESGPMLQSLLLAGPLPRWRNPPPLQPYRALPSVPTTNLEGAMGTNSRMCSASLLSFGSNQIAVAKRQRFH